MSSIFSPKPINFTGISNSSRIARTTPPRAVPSILVRTIPVIGVILENSLAWTRAFCPVEASNAKKVSWGAVGSTLLIMRPIFSNSAIRLSLFWRRPAVSIINTSTCSATARSIPSKTTLAGSDFSGPVTTGTSTRRPHSANWATAPARKVSAATNITFFPSFLYLWASFPIEVVFPTPFTPTKSMTVKPSLKLICSLYWPSFS